MQITTIHFGSHQVRAVFPSEGDVSRIPAILHYEERPTITLIGNTVIESPEYRQACFELLTKYVFPLAEERRAVLLAKGHSLSNSPEYDLAALLSKAATAAASSVPLIGVALQVAVTHSGAASVHNTQPLEPYYSDYVLVPGVNEQANSTWRSEIAHEIRRAKTSDRQPQPGITLVFGGASTSWFDIVASVEQQRPVIAITSPNGFGICNEIGRGLSTGSIECSGWLGTRAEERLTRLPASGYLHAYPYHASTEVATYLRHALTEVGKRK